MINILTFGYNNPYLSLGVLALAIFIFSIFVLRDNGHIADAITAHMAKHEVIANAYELDSKNRGYSYSNKFHEEYNESLKELKRLQKLEEDYNPIFNLISGIVIGFVPVYFLWLPLILIATPIVLAYVIVNQKSIIRKMFGKAKQSIQAEAEAEAEKVDTAE